MDPHSPASDGSLPNRAPEAADPGAETNRAEPHSPDISVEVLEELLAYASDMLTVVDVNAQFTYASPATLRMMGLHPSEVVGQAPANFIHPDDLDGLYDEATRQITGAGTSPPILYRQIGPGGRYRYVESQVTALPVDHPLGVVVVNTRDVSDRVEAEQAHQESQDVIQMVAEGRSLDEILTAIAVLIELRAPGCMAAVTRFDEETRTLRIASAPHLPSRFRSELDAASIDAAMGVSAAAARLQIAVHSTDVADDPQWDDIREGAADGGIRAGWSAPIYSVAANHVMGTVTLYWPEPAEPTSADEDLMAEAAGLATIALGRARFEAELAYRATHDSLTGLPNRTLLHDRIRQALAARRRNSTTDEAVLNEDHVVVMFVDLDRFKQVNDEFGHEAGDTLLCQAADRLRTTVREIDTVARFGGDEFIILAHTSDIAMLAGRLNEAMTATFPIAHGLQISCSIGIAIARNGDTPDALIRRADHALYQAKSEGRNRYAAEAGFTLTVGAFTSHV